MTRHESHQIRHNLVFRQLDVLRVDRLTPHMQRVVLGGPQLAGFISAAPDDHVKLFFPNRDGELVPPTLGANGIEFPSDREPSPMRDYTPRHYDAARGELTVDFVLHGDGPAATWAEQAAPGQQLGCGGPRGSLVIANDFDHYVLIGDETALPAIGRWLQEMPATVAVTAFIEIPETADRQALPTDARCELHWFDRQGSDAAASTLLEDAVRSVDAPAGDTFYWIAAESRRARAMRLFLSQERGVPKEWIKATGYWKHGDDD
ncbi:siderophore-interacting protein [Dyella koreensis]|uniref:Siderophore-interacting protein n=1 Tax=Dyella koreensis TaxID=311235 RepID=A0ABW8K749_9GAMM